MGRPRKKKPDDSCQVPIWHIRYLLGESERYCVSIEASTPEEAYQQFRKTVGSACIGRRRGKLLAIFAAGGAKVKLKEGKKCKSSQVSPSS